MSDELERFIDLWDREAAKTATLFRSLPSDAYDFRPDPEGRSLGEMAWHIAEVDGYGPWAIERGEFSRESKPAGMERPRVIEELAPAYERLHRDALERVRKLTPEDLDRSITFFNGHPIAVRDVLWSFILLHQIHHRGQLVMLTRNAGGTPVSMYGPAREAAPLRR